MSQPIHQEIAFKANADQLFAALTQGEKFTEATGAPSDVKPESGAAFTNFGGMIHGCNVEVIANRRLVQAWRVKSWEEGVYSIVRFELVPDGDQTKLIFDHTGYPEEHREHLAEGWEKNYWTPLKKYLQ